MIKSMKSIISYVIVNILCVLVHQVVDVQAGRDVIDTTYGPVKGISITLRTGKRVVQFLGIPYANASRFEPPRPPTTWKNTTFNATKFGKSCFQVANHPLFQLKPENLSEYCLNLNIYAPNTTAFQKKQASYPVLVWLHGGAYIYGTSSIYDGSTISTEGEVVVVTLNYRLGALGFLSLGEDGLDGNYGLLDIIAALRWVKNNIEGFGGDPNKVTVGGWSAGSRLVGILMLSPLASGLYHRVIMMSGHAGAHYSYLEQHEAKRTAWYFGGLLRCPYPSSDFKNCLKRKSAQDYIKAQTDRMYSSTLFANWAPVVDGKALPDTPIKLLEQGKFNITSILTGVANDDGTSYLKTMPGMNKGVEVSKGLTRKDFEKAISEKTWLRHEDNKVPAMIAFQYTDWLKPNDVNRTRRNYLDLLSDAVYIAPAVQSVNAFANKGAPVYFYQFEYREDYGANGKRRPAWINVPHRGDLRYIFPKPDMSSVSGMTKTMMDFWVNFVKSGNPNQPGDPLVWPKYDTSSQKYQAIRSFPKVESHLRAERMVFWNEFIPKNGKAQKAPPPRRAPRTTDSGATTIALIVISCLFAILVIMFIAVAVFLMLKAKRDRNQYTSQPSKAYQSPPNKQPIRSQDKTDLHSSPVHSPAYTNQSPMYQNSFKSIDKKDPYPPYPGDRYNQERDIEFVNQRSPTKDDYMESDML